MVGWVGCVYFGCARAAEPSEVSFGSWEVPLGSNKSWARALQIFAKSNGQNLFWESSQNETSEPRHPLSQPSTGLFQVSSPKPDRRRILPPGPFQRNSELAGKINIFSLSSGMLPSHSFQTLNSTSLCPKGKVRPKGIGRKHPETLSTGLWKVQILTPF